MKFICPSVKEHQQCDQYNALEAMERNTHVHCNTYLAKLDLQWDNVKRFKSGGSLLITFLTFKII